MKSHTRALPSLTDWPENWQMHHQSSSNDGKIVQMSIEQQSADLKHQSKSIPDMWSQYSEQQNLDDILQEGKLPGKCYDMNAFSYY